MPRKSATFKASEKGMILHAHCPYCNADTGFGLPGRRFLRANGDLVKIDWLWRLRRAVLEECATCGSRWPIYARDERTYSYANPLIEETRRDEEPIGDETRHIDNDSLATVQRTLRVSREWRYQLDLARSARSSSATECKVAGEGLGVTSRVERALETRYGASFSETQRFEDEVTITVPAHTSVEAVLIWKRIWQHGFIDPGMAHGRMPFSVCVGLTFDLRQHQLDSPRDHEIQMP